MRKLLTEKLVQGLTPDSAPRGGQVTDKRVPGLAVRILPSGVRTWRFQYRSPELTVDGRKRLRSTSLGEFKPGRADHVGLAAARAGAGAMRKQIAEGVDPVEQLRRDRLEAERRRASTFGKLAEEFLTEYATGYRDGGAGAKSALENDVLPSWRDRPAEAITEDDVARLVRAKARTAPVAANRLRSLLSRVFSWAIEERMLDAPNPVARVPKAVKEHPRERELSDDEIRALWLASEPGPHGLSDLANDVLAAPVAAAFRLRLLTGQRWTELVRARWENVTDERVEIGGRQQTVTIWTVPRDDTKTQLRTHVVPLSSQALGIIEALRPITERSGWMFPAYRGEGHMQSAASSFRAWKRRAGVEDFIGKDIRRTVVSGMARLGVDYEVRSAVVNHVLPGMTEKAYNRYDKLREKLVALEKWGRHVERLVTDQVADVVRLRA